jgi:cell wall-associated NlpC family hydrolase
MKRLSGQRLPGRMRMGVLLGALALVSAAQAAPEPQDAVTRLLQEKGLLNTPVAPPPAEAAPTAAPSFVQQVRTKASNVASDLVLSAMNFLGVPYKRGGQSAEAGFDCSGFTRHIFEMSLGLVLPRRSEEQARAGGLLQIKRDELKPGDLVFFNTMKRAFSHVGIYVGDNKFIHSPRSGGEVRIEDMRVAYWTKRYNGARRAPPSSSAQAAEAGQAAPAVVEAGNATASPAAVVPPTAAGAARAMVAPRAAD